jgi:hypothetical protein
MGYMFGTEVIQGLLRGGYNGIERHIQMTTHPYQYHHDLGHLYSPIKQATVHAAHVHDVLKQFERYRFTPAESTPPDGLGLFWEFKQRYGSTANILLLIPNTQQKLATLWYDRRPGNPIYLQVAWNYIDLHGRMFGYDATQRYHVVQSEAQKIPGLATILTEDSELRNFIYPKTLDAWQNHRTCTLVNFVQDLQA